MSRNGQSSRQQHTPTLNSLNGGADTPMSGPSTAPPPPSQSFPPSSGGTTRAREEALVQQEFLKKVWCCNTIGELVRLIPVPAQPISKNVLDGVYQASQKLGAAEVLLSTWQDVLRSNDTRELNKVAQLNSIRAPTVQTCKEALLGPNDGGLGSMNFDSTVKAMKLSALQHMIAIKGQEVENLRTHVQPNAVCVRLREAWDDVVAQNAASLTPEHAGLLNDGPVLERVARVAVSIGDASYKRAKLAKKERVVMRKDADVDMTDVSGRKGQKQLATVIEEALKRREQSQRDRKRSGKGKGSLGVSKKKKTPNQKQTKKKNRGPTKGGKPNKAPGAKRRERR